MPDNAEEKELAALDAIVSGILAGRAIDDMSDAELLALSASYPALSDAGRATLESFGKDPITQDVRADITSERAVLREQFAGMYREGSDSDIQPEVRAEIERKREEIRARLRSRNPRDV